MRNYTISLPYGSKLIVTDNPSVIETASNSAAENNCKLQMIDFASNDNTIFYNPFRHIRNWQDISIITDEILANPNDYGNCTPTKESKLYSQAQHHFLAALIAYMHEIYELKDQNFKTLCTLVSKDDLDLLFNNLRKNCSDSIAVNAVKEYQKFKSNKLIDEKRFPGFIITTCISISGFLHPSVDQALAQDNLDFEQLIRRKTILLIKLSPDDITFECFANMISRQIMNYYHIKRIHTYKD